MIRSARLLVSCCSVFLLVTSAGCNHEGKGVHKGDGDPLQGDGGIGVGDTAGDGGSNSGSSDASASQGDGGATSNCEDALDLQGCACSVTNDTRPCFTGPAESRNLNLCHDGIQTCMLSGEFHMWGPCLGSITACGDCSPNHVEACYDGPPSTDGVGICKDGVHYCDASGHFGPCLFETTPGSEVCGDGKDNDCNNKIDCDDPACPCVCKPGASQSCYTGPTGTENVGLCHGGMQICSALGQWGACTGEVLPGPEQCWSGVDANCNGTMGCQDAACGCICAPGTTQACYGGPPGSEGVGLCHGGTQLCSDMGQWGPCSGQVLPTPETAVPCMSGIDSNCNGQVGCDDISCGCVCAPGDTQSCYTGPANTEGVGPCHGGTQQCTLYGQWDTCQGQVIPAPEQCTDLVDNSCNGKIDCADSACQTCCNATDQTLPLPQANVLFVVDRSASMATKDMGNNLSRWDALSQAVFAVLPGLDSAFHMGLLLFSKDGASNSNVCDVYTTPNVGLSQPSASAIDTLIQNTYPWADTPTYQALNVAKSYYSSVSTTLPKFIALLTDGEPNCSYGVPDVVGVLQSLHGIGIDTFVVGIPGGDSTLVSNLNTFADAGGRPQAGATHFYPATSPLSFQQSLQGIAIATAGCTFDLPSSPNNPNNVTVKVDGTVVPFDATDGWQYKTATKIHFNGSSCNQINSGAVKKITVKMGC